MGGGTHRKIHAKTKWKFYFLDLKEIFSGLEKINFTACFNMDPPPLSLDSMGTRLKIDFSGRAKNEKPFPEGGALVSLFNFYFQE